MTMNPKVPDELISAYFDGEVTPDERQQIERQLESSADLRQMLDDTSKLSALLHSFPREAAPGSLSSNVKSRITNATAPVVPAPPPAKRSLAREWMAFAAGIAITAASLLLVVFVGPSRDSKNMLADRSTAAPAASTLAYHSAPAFNNGPAAASSPAIAAKDATEGTARYFHSRTEELASRDGVAAATSASAVAVPTEAPSNSDQFQYEASANASLAKTEAAVPLLASSEELPSEITPQPQQSEDFLRALKKGDVVMQYVANPNNTIMVVEMTVVDIDKGAEMLEMVLERVLKKDESIEPVPAQARTAAATVAKDDTKKASSADNLIVLYVRAPGERLADALAESTKNVEVYRAFSPQFPMEFTNLVVANTANSNGLVGVTPGKPMTPNALLFGVDQDAKEKETLPASKAPSVADEANLVVNNFASQNGMAVDEKSIETRDFKQNRDKLVRQFGALGRVGDDSAKGRVVNTDEPEVDSNSIAGSRVQKATVAEADGSEQFQGFAAFRVAANRRPISTPVQKKQRANQRNLSQRNFINQSETKPGAAAEKQLPIPQPVAAGFGQDPRLMRLLIVLKSDQANSPSE